MDDPLYDASLQAMGSDCKPLPVFCIETNVNDTHSAQTVAVDGVSQWLTQSVRDAWCF